MVLMWSTPAGELDSVQANSYGYGEDPGSVFADLATSTSGSDEARAWVEQNFATAETNPVSKRVGGVDFVLKGGGQTRILSINASST